MDILENCTLCPKMCGVNRKKGETGFCGADDKVKIARCDLHFWEEPCISGEKGSGTVFFSHCNLRCVYCQNHKISHMGVGKTVSEEELAGSFLMLQEKGANNINLVTPTHYVPQIIEAVKLSREKGLTLPILYNSSGYENVETIKMLHGIVDIYLPDLKYFDDKYAKRYSGVNNYFAVASRAISEMYKSVGKCVFDENGIIKKGVIVRHMMLPHLLFDSKKVIDYLFKTYGDDIFISIMNQYTPVSILPKSFPRLNQKISKEYYDTLIGYAVNLGVKNAYIQEGDTAKESFIPEFFDE
ncbi:MAG: radical SAM protein [Clostridia bacterium]|nr:radical SAM protein [Clostridia bacterium]